MCEPATAPQIMDREFLETRAKLLELAAALDRLDRAQGSVADDFRSQRIQQALSVLADDEADRAAQIQLIFSLPFHTDWRSRFGLADSSA